MSIGIDTELFLVLRQNVTAIVQQVARQRLAVGQGDDHDVMFVPAELLVVVRSNPEGAPYDLRHSQTVSRHDMRPAYVRAHEEVVQTQVAVLRGL
jgi:hypothetical protein